MKKILLGILLLIMVLALTACACKHEETKLINVVDSTCTVEGYSGDTFCVKCEETIAQGQAVEVRPHTEGELTDAKEPTCIEEGYTGDIYCTECNGMLTEGESIPALGHTEGEVTGAYDATCTRDGYTGDVYCVVCDELLTEGTTIPATGHTEGELTDMYEATCTVYGYTGDIFCTVCGELLQSGEVIPALNHDVTIVDCELDTVCNRCNETIPGFDHQWLNPTRTAPRTCQVCNKTKGNPLNIPFYCTEPVVQLATEVPADEFLNSYFSRGTINVRTDYEAIDYYASTEGVDALYDDGETILLTSTTGYYIGNVENDKTAKITALLEMPYGMGNDQYSRAGGSVYKNEHGFWVFSGYMLLYINLDNNQYYYLDLRNCASWNSFNDRYFAYQPSGQFIVIDRETGDAQIMSSGTIEFVPYFDENGVAIIADNSEYYYSDIDYRPDFYLYNRYWYYSWENACSNRVESSDGKCIVYLDSDAIIVEDEFTFNKLVDGETVWKISKKDIVNNSRSMYSIQTGRLWQYGNGSSYYNTYLVPEETSLATYALGENTRLDWAHLVGYSGRYSDFYDYDFVRSLDHMAVFDQTTYTVYNLNRYHRNNRIYNQDHVLWNSNLNKDMGGIYGVYNFESGNYVQRSLTY